MRPCDQCGGSGRIVVSITNTHAGQDVRPDPATRGPCSRCVDMPKLPWPVRQSNLRYEFDPVERGWEAAKRGWFKPDPDSIMWWCFEHGSPSYGTRFKMPVDWCDYAQALLTVCESDEDETAVGKCSFGWVERPTRLEVVE